MLLHVIELVIAFDCEHTLLLYVNQRSAWIRAVKAANERSGEEWNFSDIKEKSQRICTAHFVFGTKNRAENAVNYVPTLFPKRPCR